MLEWNPTESPRISLTTHHDTIDFPQIRERVSDFCASQHNDSLQTMRANVTVLQDHAHPSNDVLLAFTDDLKLACARWYQAESGHGQHLQECQRLKEDARTPRRKTKQQSKKQHSNDDWEEDANSESDGTDFEAEYLVKARARRHCSFRR